MSVEAHIVADSINSTGNRLTTFVAKYPRFIHSEVLTHRTLSRNSASSRAIPIEKMIQRVLDDPVIPHWSTNRKGMQEGDELDENASRQAKEHWLTLLYKSVEYAHQLASQGIAKSVVNRLLEPWMHIEVVLSATEWHNFFRLRDDKGAEPHIRDLAHMMCELMRNSEPVVRDPGMPSFCELMGHTAEKLDEFINYNEPQNKGASWHLPFVPEINSSYWPFTDYIKESVAHCFWVSYLNQWKEGYTQEDVERVYQQVLANPPHVSPTEHVAVACSGPHRHGNFVGWCQWRSFLPNESGGDYTYSHNEG